MGIEELQSQMAAAIANNDVGAMEAVAAQIVASKKERAKVEAVKLQKEAEQLAGKREALAAEVFKAVGSLGLDDKLRALKARGFSYYVKTSYTVPGEPEVHQQASCGLILGQALKVKKAAGGGGTGKSKDEYGMSLGEIVEKWGTDKEKAEIAATESNSKSWQLKVAVKKRVLASGELKPAK